MMTAAAINALVVLVDGRWNTRELVPDPLLRVYQQVVGGYVQIVYPCFDWHAYSDDRWIQQGTPLPLNPLATALIRTEDPRSDPLFGDVVFVGAGTAGHDADVPTVLVRRAEQYRSLPPPSQH